MLEKLSYSAAGFSATLLQTLVLLLDMLADGFSAYSKPAGEQDYQGMPLLWVARAARVTQKTRTSGDKKEP